MCIDAALFSNRSVIILKKWTKDSQLLKKKVNELAGIIMFLVI